jgi:hypothetical protein
MKPIRFISKIFALMLLMPALNIGADELESALKAALEETSTNPVDVFTPAFKLFGHRFGVQPVELIEKQERRWTLAGKLTRLSPSGGAKDEIAYRIIKERGAVKEITWKVKDGEWRALSQPMMDALGDYRKGLPMPEEKQREVEAALKKAVDETWQRAAEFLMAHIAVRHC